MSMCLSTLGVDILPDSRGGPHTKIVSVNQRLPFSISMGHLSSLHAVNDVLSEPGRCDNRYLFGLWSCESVR